MRNNSKRSDAAAMALFPQTEQEYLNLTLNNRNRRYIEDLKQLYSLLEDIILGTYGNEGLGEAAVRNKNGT